MVTPACIGDIMSTIHSDSFRIIPIHSNSFRIHEIRVFDSLKSKEFLVSNKMHKEQIHTIPWMKFSKKMEFSIIYHL